MILLVGTQNSYFVQNYSRKHFMDSIIKFSSSEARENWSEIMRKAQSHIVEIASNGKPDVYIISPEEFKKYQEIKLHILKAEIQIGIQQADKGEFSGSKVDDVKKRVLDRRDVM